MPFFFFLNRISDLVPCLTFLFVLFPPTWKLVRGLQTLRGNVAYLTKDASLMVAGRRKHPGISAESNWSCFQMSGYHMSRPI